MARSSKPTFARIILFRCVISGLRARDGFTADVARVTGQALDPALTRSKFQHDPERPRPLDSSARARAQRIESGQSLPHDPPAALGDGEQALSEVLEMLLDREAANRATLEIGSGRVGAKQLALDVDGEIANPAGHSDEVLMMAVGPVPYSSRSRRRRSSSTT